MTADLPDDIREMIRTQEHMLANPGAPADPPPPVATHLTREMIDAVYAQLMQPPLVAGYYRPVGVSSAYAAVRMPDGTMSEGCGDTVEHAITNAHQNWREQS